MTMNLTRSLAIALGVAASAFALGCTPSLDGKTVESSIKDQCSKMGITLSTISCPPTVKAQQGGTFNCTSTTSDGDAISWEVTQKDAVGGFDFKSPSVMDEQKLGDQVEPQLASQAGGPIDMKCPSKWIVPKSGAKFSCDATAKGAPATVDCTFSEGTKYDCHMH